MGRGGDVGKGEIMRCRDGGRGGDVGKGERKRCSEGGGEEM